MLRGDTQGCLQLLVPKLVIRGDVFDSLSDRTAERVVDDEVFGLIAAAQLFDDVSAGSVEGDGEDCNPNETPGQPELPPATCSFIQDVTHHQQYGLQHREASVGPPLCGDRDVVVVYRAVEEADEGVIGIDGRVIVEVEEIADERGEPPQYESRSCPSAFPKAAQEEPNGARIEAAHARAEQIVFQAVEIVAMSDEQRAECDDHEGNRQEESDRQPRSFQAARKRISGAIRRHRSDDQSSEDRRKYRDDEREVVVEQVQLRDKEKADTDESQ